MWGLSLNKANHWKDLEKPLVSIIARMMSKASVPHHINPGRDGSSPYNH